MSQQKQIQQLTQNKDQFLIGRQKASQSPGQKNIQRIFQDSMKQTIQFQNQIASRPPVSSVQNTSMQSTAKDFILQSKSDTLNSKKQDFSKSISNKLEGRVKSSYKNKENISIRSNDQTMKDQKNLEVENNKMHSVNSEKLLQIIQQNIKSQMQTISNDLQTSLEAIGEKLKSIQKQSDSELVSRQTQQALLDGLLPLPQTIMNAMKAEIGTQLTQYKAEQNVIMQNIIEKICSEKIDTFKNEFCAKQKIINKQINTSQEALEQKCVSITEKRSKEIDQIGNLQTQLDTVKFQQKCMQEKFLQMNDKITEQDLQLAELRQIQYQKFKQALPTAQLDVVIETRNSDQMQQQVGIKQGIKDILNTSLDNDKTNCNNNINVYNQSPHTDNITSLNVKGNCQEQEYGEYSYAETAKKTVITQAEDIINSIVHQETSSNSSFHAKKLKIFDPIYQSMNETTLQMQFQKNNQIINSRDATANCYDKLKFESYLKNFNNIETPTMTITIQDASSDNQTMNQNSARLYQHPTIGQLQLNDFISPSKNICSSPVESMTTSPMLEIKDLDCNNIQQQKQTANNEITQVCDANGVHNVQQSEQDYQCKEQTFLISSMAIREKLNLQNTNLQLKDEQSNTEDIIYQIDENGFLINELGNRVLDDNGEVIQLNEEHIQCLKNANMYEETIQDDNS